MIDRVRFLGEASELLLFLGLLHFLYVGGLTSLGFFGFGPFYPGHRQVPLFALYYAVFLATTLAPGRFRETILLAGGLAGGLVAYPELMLGLIILVSVVYLVVHHLGRRAWIKLLSLAGLHVCLGLWSACSPYGQRLSLVFVALTFFRTLLYLHAMAVKGFPRGNIADYVRFQLPIASFIIHPYLGVIPPFGERKDKRPLEDLVADGRRLIRAGLLALLAARLAGKAAAMLFPGEVLEGAGMPATLLVWHWRAMLRLLVVLLDTSACAGFLGGLMLMLGWDIKPAMNRPWRSESLFEYWNRFIIHFKDFQVTFFYYPTVLALRRHRREVAIVVAVAMTFLVGNNVVHILGRYLYSAERHTLLLHGVRANLALTAVMALAFLWEEYKQRCRREGRRVPFGSRRWPVRAVKIYLTLTVVSWIWHL